MANQVRPGLSPVSSADIANPLQLYSLGFKGLELFLSTRLQAGNPSPSGMALFISSSTPATAKSLQSWQPHRWQPTRLPRPWDSPGKNTGVVCHFLLQCVKVRSESEVAQSCPTLSDPMDRSPPGSSVHGIFQARVLEWVPLSSTPAPRQTSSHFHVSTLISAGSALSWPLSKATSAPSIPRARACQGHGQPLCCQDIPQFPLTSEMLGIFLQSSYPGLTRPFFCGLLEEGPGKLVATHQASETLTPTPLLDR